MKLAIRAFFAWLGGLMAPLLSALWEKEQGVEQERSREEAAHAKADEAMLETHDDNAAAARSGRADGVLGMGDPGDHDK
jgi:hypothetical protein